MWKQATIIPNPKVGKPRDFRSSHRYISLLCPEIKILERLLHSKLTHDLQLTDSNTVLNLLPLVQKEAVGFNQAKPLDRTVPMTIEFSKVFDTVNHTKLLQAFTNSTLSSVI